MPKGTKPASTDNKKKLTIQEKQAKKAEKAEKKGK